MDGCAPTKRARERTSGERGGKEPAREQMQGWQVEGDEGVYLLGASRRDSPPLITQTGGIRVCVCIF